MLHTDPIPRLDGDEFARVYRRRPSLDSTHPDGRPYETEAFHWGSLTTGHWLTSLWILLAPFALANVAGWMAERRGPFHRTAIRLAGLSLTALFVAQIGYFVVGVPVLALGGPDPGVPVADWARLGLSLAWVLLFGAIVLRLSTQSHFDPMRYGARFRLLFWPTIDSMRPGETDAPSDSFDDPGRARLTDEVMWSPHSILHRLRRVHFAAGQLLVALALARSIHQPLLEAMAVAGLALCIGTIAWTSYAPKTRPLLHITAWLPLVAEVIALSAVATFALAGVEADIDALHRTTFHVAIAVGITAGLSALAGIPSVGALTLATFIGGAFGVGAGLIVEDLLDVSGGLELNGGAWVAPAALIFVLLLLLLGVVLTFFPPPELSGEGLVSRLLTRLTRRSRQLLVGGAAFGLGMGLIAILEGCVLPTDACDPSALAEFGGADLAVVALMGAVLVLIAVRMRHHSIGLSASAFLLAAVVIWVGSTKPTIWGFSPAGYLEALPLARTLIFVAPVFAILRSVLGAYRQGASSRKVGVIWDVVSFWPRWFHPLGPPAYGPKVVTELTKLVSNGDADIIAAHSQGSVIASIASNRASREDGTRVGLLTYGSPIGHLYGPLFPDVGMRQLVEHLPSELSGGWSNLWRLDDPIGAEPLGGSVESTLETSGSGHSGYELTSAFRRIRDNMATDTPDQ